MSAKLKPCPFCAEMPFAERTFRSFTDQAGEWRIRCGRCSAFGPTGASLVIASKRWNRRPAPRARKGSR